MFYLKLLPDQNCTILMNNHGCLTRSLKIAYKVCPFGIGTLRLRKHEKFFWECIFALLSLKRKIDIEGQHLYYFSHEGTLSQTETKLNWLPMMPFLVYMHGRHFTFGKLFVGKLYNILIFFNPFCEKCGSANRIIKQLLL